MTVAEDMSRGVMVLTITPAARCPRRIFLCRSTAARDKDNDGAFVSVEMRVTDEHECRVHGVCSPERCALVVASDAHDAFVTAAGEHDSAHVVADGSASGDDVRSSHTRRRRLRVGRDSSNTSESLRPSTNAHACEDDSMSVVPQHQCVSLAPTDTPSAWFLRGLGRALGIALVLGCPVGVKLSPALCKVLSLSLSLTVPLCMTHIHIHARRS